MTTLYVAAAPGSVGAPSVTLTVTGASGPLVVPSLQDITINNANDVFTWTQLNEASKLQVATTSTNSISTNVVVEELTFFGNAASTTGSAAKLGLIGLSNAKTLTGFSVTMGSKTITGNCYITGLAPKISADQPVWVTPVTLTVSGAYVIS